MSIRRGLAKADYTHEMTELEGSLAAGSTSLSYVREIPHVSEVQVGVEVIVTFDAAATDGVRVRLLQSSDGMNFDTETDLSFTISVSAGNRAQRSVQFQVFSRYYRIEITNLDGSVAVTVNSVKVMEFPYYNYFV